MQSLLHLRTNKNNLLNGHLRQILCRVRHPVLPGKNRKTHQQKNMKFNCKFSFQLFILLCFVLIDWIWLFGCGCACACGRVYFLLMLRCFETSLESRKLALTESARSSVTYTLLPPAICNLSACVFVLFDWIWLFGCGCACGRVYFLLMLRCFETSLESRKLALTESARSSITYTLLPPAICNLSACVFVVFDWIWLFGCTFLSFYFFYACCTLFNNFPLSELLLFFFKDLLCWSAKLLFVFILVILHAYISYT